MNEALALLEKYGRKTVVHRCPDDLRGVLKDLSDLYIQTGRKLSRASLEKEIRSRGHNVSYCIIYHWIKDAGGEPWFGPA